MKRMEVLLAVALVAIAVTIALAPKPRSAEAHSTDAGFIWAVNGYNYENVKDSSGSSSWAVASGVADWYNFTRLWTNTDPYASFYEIEYVSSNFGATGWQAYVNVYSNNYTCWSPSVTPPGGCDKVVEKATTAVIYLNTYYTSTADMTNRPVAAKHEIGHVFGLTHGPTCEWNLMDMASCTPHATSITTHDTQLVANLY